MIRRKRLIALAVPALLFAYLTYVFFAFDIMGLAGRVRLDNAITMASDSWSYKTHVTRGNRSGEMVIAIEGERKGAYPKGMKPDLVTLEGANTSWIWAAAVRLPPSFPPMLCALMCRALGGSRGGWWAARW